MLKIARYVLSQIWEGIKDNLKALYQIFRHPINTFLAMLKAIIHPIDTLQKLWRFAWSQPIRFLTNIGLSFLEGHYAMVSWNKLTTAEDAASLAAELAVLPETNSTLTAIETLQEGVWQGVTNLFSTTSKAPMSCTTHCTLRSAQVSIAAPTATSSGTTATTVLNSDPTKAKPA